MPNSSLRLRAFHGVTRPINMRILLSMSVCAEQADSDSDSDVFVSHKTHPLHTQRHRRRRQDRSQEGCFLPSLFRSIYSLPPFPSTFESSYIGRAVSPKLGPGRNPGRNTLFGVFRAEERV